MTPYDYEANKHRLLSSSGQRLTSQLFEELARDDVAAKPVFKLADWRKTYVEVADPTGYEAAKVLIGNWDHWLQLCKSPGFAAALIEWNEEVDTKLRSEGYANLRRQASKPTGVAAARWLAENGAKVPRNRKSKEDSEGKGSRSIRDDLRRLGLGGD